MSIEDVSEILTDRLSTLHIFDDGSFAESILLEIREWLDQVTDVPPKDVVLAATAKAINNIFAGIDTPGPDVIVEPILTQSILVLIAFAYDQIASEAA